MCRRVSLALPGLASCSKHSRSLSSETCREGTKGREQGRKEICLLVLEGEDEGKRISKGLAGSNVQIFFFLVN